MWYDQRKLFQVFKRKWRHTTACLSKVKSYSTEICHSLVWLEIFLLPIRTQCTSSLPSSYHFLKCTSLHYTTPRKSSCSVLTWFITENWTCLSNMNRSTPSHYNAASQKKLHLRWPHRAFSRTTWAYPHSSQPDVNVVIRSILISSMLRGFTLKFYSQS